MSENVTSIKKISDMYRVKVLCLNCGKTYVSNLLHKLKIPRRCKFCGSTKLSVRDHWRLM